MLDSSLRVEHLTGGQLRVVAPPYLLMFIVWSTAAAIPFLFFGYRTLKSRSLGPLVGMVLFCTPFLLAALASARSGSVTLDRVGGTATVVQPSFLGHTTSVLPLHDIQYAQIRTGRSSSRVYLVLQNGDATPFSDSTSQGGQGRAVQAINDYLGVRR